MVEQKRHQHQPFGRSFEGEVTGRDGTGKVKNWQSEGKMKATFFRRRERGRGGYSSRWGWENDTQRGD